MSAIDFRKIEVKICEKERLNPQLDIDIAVNVSYISPQGRNRYFKSKTINLDGLEYIFALRNQKIQYQKIGYPCGKSYHHSFRYLSDLLSDRYDLRVLGILYRFCRAQCRDLFWRGHGARRRAGKAALRKSLRAGGSGGIRQEQDGR